MAGVALVVWTKELRWHTDLSDLESTATRIHNPDHPPGSESPELPRLHDGPTRLRYLRCDRCFNAIATDGSNESHTHSRMASRTAPHRARIRTP